MAVVLDALASYIQNMLMQMAAEEVHMLLGVSSEIDNIGIKLRDLKNFLPDADRRNITDQSVQAWVRELRDAMYDATDILDLCQLKAMEQGPRHDVGCFNPLLFCIRNPLHAHDIGSRIKNLNKKLDGIKARSASFNFINLGANEDRRRNMVSSSLGSRETSGGLDETGLVGKMIEEDTRNLVELLTKVDQTHRLYNKIMVFAIVGVGGIGKTTLARKIFNNDIVQQEFSKKIWLSVSQDYNELDILRRVIIEARGDNHVAGDTKATLERLLKEALKGHKTLLIMDDVWDYRAWEDVLRTPLVNAVANNGSRVLITTRDDIVARGMMAEEPYHHIRKLEPEDAWLLLKKQVIVNVNDEPQIEMFKDIGMKIIDNCDCLPLAVKVMGGLLRQKRTTRGDWEYVLHSSIQSISEVPKELNYAIYLSYQDLHPCLKPCFLHYSLLPKSILFSVDEIVGMWISEGFIHGSSGGLEELGREYYGALIQRNLIEPDITYTEHQVCHMQEVVRSFAQYVCRDETLICHRIGTDITDKLNSEKFIRLSLETRGSESSDLEWSFLESQISLRTLITAGKINIESGDSLVSFSSLRVLHVQHAKIDALVESLYQLIHLRYLSIEHTNISVLPENIGNMKFLQYVSLFGCKSLVKLPNSIGKLQQLRLINLDGTSISNIPKGFNGLTSLRKIDGFLAHMDGDWCSLEVLRSLPYLTRLHISRLENVSSSSFARKVRLGEKLCLRYLYLSCTSRHGDDSNLIEEDDGIPNKGKKQIKQLFDELCPPPCLENLGIKGYFGLKLPRWMMSAAVVSLRILTLEDLPCCMELPNGLCQLPCLELLQIDRAPAMKRFGHEFINPYHDRDNHSRQAVAGFPGLRELNFSGMTGWEEWEWEQNVHAMPVLEELLLKGCRLRRVPPGLSFSAGALRKLYVYNVQHLRSLENFASIVHLQVFESHDMERISNFPSLQKLEIVMCPKMKVLEGLPVLQRLELEDYSMKALPEYLMDVNPSYLFLWYNFSLLTSLATDFREWDKCIRSQQVKAYTSDGEIAYKWYVQYSRDPFNFETNISRSIIAHGLRDRTSELQALEHIHAKRKKPCNLSLSLLKFLTKNFSNKCKIGHGGCGEVYKGVLPNGGIVAVKRLFKNYTMEDKMFGREVKSMMLVEHNNIVRFLGYCSDTQGLASSLEGNFLIAEKRKRLLCFEYINNGSLENHITDELRGSEWHTRYQIIKGICKGLDYLHNKKGIIHMDLKPPNILVDDHMVPKISDFGISRLDGKSQTTTTRFFSPGYSAPEYFFNGQRSFKSDIYSLGMIIIETVTGSKENPNIAKVHRRWRHRWNKSSKYTALWHQQVTKCLQLALRCRQQEPKHRPCILDIIRELDKVCTGGAQQLKDDTEFTSQQMTQTFVNDMLGIEPLELHIPSALDTDISRSIKLTNGTNDYIAFWIPINILRIPYFVRPDKGVIPPQSNCSVTVTFQAQEKEPPHNYWMEFCVKSTLGHENLTSMDITEDMFNEEEPDKIVDEVNLSVRFDMPELLVEEP